MQNWKRSVVWAVAASLAAAVPLTAGESTITRNDLPPAVSRAIDARYAHAEVRGFTREPAGHRTHFEAELTVGGKKVDATFDDRGILVEEERGITLAECPGSVREAFAASPHRRGVILGVERVLRPSQSRAPRYELRVSEPPNTFEFVYDANGRLTRGRKVTGGD